MIGHGALFYIFPYEAGNRLKLTYNYYKNIFESLMPSFDIVSTIDHHELDNAIDQSKREIANRFDFKGTSASIDKAEKITVFGDNQFQLDQIRDILRQKVAKRGIDPSSLSFLSTQQHHANVKQDIDVLEGIDSDLAKKIVKTIKEKKLKVQTSIQGDTVRVNGKKRDDLQEVISFLKQVSFDRPLQFQNFRD